jgi:glycosyltransferase involved in cell wall biosynthesis
MNHNRWAILTGEYPPQPGGVSDYTHQLAHALADAGDEVHVWAPACSGPPETASPVQIHRLPDHFGPRGLLALGTQLNQLPRPYRILLQYVPHAYGYKAMNFPLCLWLSARAKRDELWMQFHEVAYPFEPAQPWRHRLLAHVTHRMARRVARAAHRIFVTTPAWLPRVQRWARTPHPIQWLPVPSTLPMHANERQVEQIRRTFPPNARLIGHFGTFGPAIAGMLQSIVPPLLQDHPDRVALLVGRGGNAFTMMFLEAAPHLSNRIVATGGLPPQEAADHLAACDLLLQPYPDGATCRRSSLMAGLALGKPIVTTTGQLSEPFWPESRAAALAPADSPDGIIAEVERLLSDPPERDALGRRAQQAYDATFAIEHTVATLLKAADNSSVSEVS